jgi:ABC-type multidrug transport system fused ATPase/permease subunit
MDVTEVYEMKTRPATFREFCEAIIEMFKMAFPIAIYLMIALTVVALILWVIMTVFMHIPADTIGQWSAERNDMVVGLAPTVIILFLLVTAMMYFEGRIQVRETKKGKKFYYND